jgi:hypothetical protein
VSALRPDFGVGQIAADYRVLRASVANVNAVLTVVPT